MVFGVSLPSFEAWLGVCSTAISLTKSRVATEDSFPPSAPKNGWWWHRVPMQPASASSTQTNLGIRFERWKSSKASQSRCNFCIGGCGSAEAGRNLPQLATFCFNFYNWNQLGIQGLRLSAKHNLGIPWVSLDFSIVSCCTLFLSIPRSMALVKITLAAHALEVGISWSQGTLNTLKSFCAFWCMLRIAPW